MEQCLGCIGMLFGSRQRKRRLKYLVNYKDGDDRNLGVEFENLVLDDGNQQSYGTHMQVLTSEERDYVTKRQYDRIIEEQRKVDEQIDKKLFDEEELLRVEEEAYYEAQREAAKAASMTLSLKERSSSLAVNPTDSESRNSLTLEEVEDDFEDFLEEVRNRSIAFRNQYASKETGLPEESVPDTSLDRGGDGQSSDEDFVLAEKQSKNQEKVEWDSYTSGIDHLPPENLRDAPLEKRLDPVGVGGGDNLSSRRKWAKSSTPKEAVGRDKRLEQAERMFSITDDEDMGDYVHA